MQRYIEQLIADIHQASWNLKPPHELWMESGADPDNELELEDMSFIEEYVEDENLLCQMNRFDQRNNPDFKCGAFEEL